MGDVEIVARVERRRKWTPEEKAALLAEVEAEGGRVSVVARRHRISDSVLYNWRSAWKVAAEMVSGEAVEFVPVGVMGDREAAIATPPALPKLAPPTMPHKADGSGRIEIELPGGARVHVETPPHPG